MCFSIFKCNDASFFFQISDMGRVASQFYIKYDTIEVFNECLAEVMNECAILATISQSSEFGQMKVLYMLLL